MAERIFPASQDQLGPVQDFIAEELERCDCPPRVKFQIDVAVEEVFVTEGQFVHAGDPLYTYVYWQETTLHAGEDPDAEREYLEVFRTQVRSDSNAVTTEVLSDTLEGVGDAINIEGLGGLLTFSAEVSQETADALRDPGQFAGA